MEIISGIYKITNPNGKVYIGQSHDINRRFKMYKRLECKGQKHLYSSLLKYGYDAHVFEILEQCPPEDMDNLEIKYISFYDSTNREFGMNLQTGGTRGKDSEETLLLKRINHPKRVIFYAERDGVVKRFDSMTEAEKTLGVTRKSIRLSLKNPDIKIGKYSYSYEYPTTISHNKKKRVQSQETRMKISLNHWTKKKK